MGRWFGHAWVVVGDAVIDITADQFGEVDIVHTSEADPAYRHGDRAECQLLPTKRGLDAIDEIWPFWCLSADG